MEEQKNETILIFSAHVSKWGAERSTCSLAKYLQDTGHNVLLIIPHEGPILDILQENNLHYVVIPFYLWLRGNNLLKTYLKGSIYRLLNLIRIFKLKKILNQMNIKPVLVYSNTIVFDMGLLVALFYRIPHVQHIRENVYTFGMKFFWGYSLTLWFVSRCSRMVICTCRSIMEVYFPFIPKGNITFQYNGVPIADAVSANKLQQINGVFDMVAVARLNEDKRIEDVVKAVGILVKKGVSNIHLDIYGEGDCCTMIEQYIEDNHLGNYITLKGFCKKIDYSPYLIGILASTFEAFARSVLEYMVNRLAVIGSDSGGTKEQVVDMETGMLFEPHNIVELSEKIEFLESHRELCIQMGLKGRKRVETYFSQDRYVKGVSAIIISYIQ